MRNAITCAVLVAALTLPASADVWDPDDDSPTTSLNAISHGFDQVHDLPGDGVSTEDVDFYFLGFPPEKTSWEVVIDGFSSNVANASSPALERVTYDDTTILQSAGAIPGLQVGKSLRWQVPTAPVYQMAKVHQAACGVACNTLDDYRIRAWETTIAIPRYNNAGAQVTVLIVQNPGIYTVNGTVYLWSTAGALVTSFPFTLVSDYFATSKPALVQNLATVNAGAAAGTSGTITITHDARYGDLAAKAVALEPTTGFSFDSPGLYKLH